MYELYKLLKSAEKARTDNKKWINYLNIIYSVYITK